MIKYSIRGENLEVTKAIHDYVVSKLEKIEINVVFSSFFILIYSTVQSLYFSENE